jgi:hypothetical protein
MRQKLSSSVFPRIEEAVQHAVTGAALHVRVSKALLHLAPVLGLTYEPQAEALFSELRKLIDDPRVIFLPEGPNFSGVPSENLKRWLRALLRLYGLASYELASDSDMRFFFNLPDRKNTRSRKIST